MSIIAPSILSADFTKLGAEIREVTDAGADWIHIDVMDGQFVPNISYGPVIVEASKKSTDALLDVHLMIETPDLMIPEFVKAGADLISVHAEACTHLDRSVQLIKSLGVKAGVALNPATPLSAVEWVLRELDFVLIMSVNPGFGGQSFIETSLEKISSLREMITGQDLETVIQVDGGVSSDTVERIAEAGADSFVAGSAIFNSPDYKQTIRMFREKIDSAGK